MDTAYRTKGTNYAGQYNGRDEENLKQTLYYPVLQNLTDQSKERSSAEWRRKTFLAKSLYSNMDN